MWGLLRLAPITVCDTDNLHFPQACRLLRVTAQQYVGTRVAICGSFVDYAMRKTSMNEHAIVCTPSKMGILAVRLVLRLSPGPHQRFCYT